MASENSLFRLRKEQRIKDRLAKESSQQKTRLEQVWEILNHRFILFALSTVLLGFGGFLYKQYQDQHQAYIRRLEQVGRLRTEFLGRVDHLFRSLSEVNALGEQLKRLDTELARLNDEYESTGSALTEKSTPELVKRAININQRREQLLLELQDIKTQHRKARSVLTEDEIPPSGNSYADFRARSALSLALEFDSLCTHKPPVDHLQSVAQALKDRLEIQSRSGQTEDGQSERSKLYTRASDSLQKCSVN